MTTLICLCCFGIAVGCRGEQQPSPSPPVLGYEDKRYDDQAPTETLAAQTSDDTLDVGTNAKTDGALDADAGGGESVVESMDAVVVGSTDSAASFGSPAAGLEGPGSEWQLQIDAVRSGGSQSIRVTDQAITAEDLRLLEQTPQLTELVLDAGRVTDNDLALIIQLSNLEHLRLRQSPLSDAGIAALIGLQKLRIINLPQAEMTHVGIEKLAELPSLVQLRLSGRQLDDRAVSAMAKLPNLHSLHLIGPDLTDAALDSLASAPRLTSFYLDDCHLSDAAWERLFKAKPNLHVHINQAHHDRDPHPTPH